MAFRRRPRRHRLGFAAESRPTSRRSSHRVHPTPSDPSACETRDPTLHGRCRQPCGFVGLQTLPRKTPRGEMGSRRGRGTLSRWTGLDLRLPLEVQALRAKWKTPQRSGVSPRSLCRRHGLHPQSGGQERRPFAGDLASGHRIPDSGISGRGLLDQLRAGVHERKPAHLRGDARLARNAFKRRKELGLGIPAR